MGLICGLVGLPSCGKTVIFNAITAAGVSSYNGSEMNRAVVNIPDQRINRLVELYHPRKTTLATLEVVDIPGVGNSPQGTGRGSKLLGNIKDVDALLHVVRCFENGSAQKIDPVRDIETVDLELLAADATTLENKITRLSKKARVGDKDAVRDTAACEKVHKAIQDGIPARKQGLNELELAAVWECNLVSLKPVFYVANIASMADAARPEVTTLKELARKEGAEVITICGKDEADISQLDPKDRPEFLRELGLTESSVERLLGAASKMLGIVHFFTSGEDEVRAWTCHKGDKAPVAAGKIHSDMEKGFIRMEVTRYDDLMELGSEAAVAKAGKHRVESRDYEVQDGDIVMVLFNS
ncbi:MAG: redox-regulated ATPase YchF [Dehalococcoidales bacterium]|nr:redox-regulated ATPase YchF [Dehalococcoidales bacterium]